MSRRALNPQQLAMFMPVQEVIDKVHKIDASEHVAAGRSPREQWEEPLTEGMYAGSSVRDAKLSAAQATRDYEQAYPPRRLAKYDIEAGARAHNVPPLRIQHVPAGLYTNRDRQELWDGHHRLATLEAMGHTEVPVWHSFDDDEDTPHEWRGVPRRRP